MLLLLYRASQFYEISVSEVVNIQIYDRSRHPVQHVLHWIYTFLCMSKNARKYPQQESIVDHAFWVLLFPFTGQDADGKYTSLGPA